MSNKRDDNNDDDDLGCNGDLRGKVMTEMAQIDWMVHTSQLLRNIQVKNTDIEEKGEEAIFQPNMTPTQITITSA